LGHRLFSQNYPKAKYGERYRPSGRRDPELAALTEQMSHRQPADDEKNAEDQGSVEHRTSEAFAEAFANAFAAARNTPTQRQYHDKRADPAEEAALMRWLLRQPLMKGYKQRQLEFAAQRPDVTSVTPQEASRDMEQDVKARRLQQLERLLREP